MNKPDIIEVDLLEFNANTHEVDIPKEITIYIPGGRQKLVLSGTRASGVIVETIDRKMSWAMSGDEYKKFEKLSDVIETKEKYAYLTYLNDGRQISNFKKSYFMSAVAVIMSIIALGLAVVIPILKS